MEDTQIDVHSLKTEGIEYVVGINCRLIRRVRPGVYDIYGTEEQEAEDVILRVRDPKMVRYSRRA